MPISGHTTLMLWATVYHAQMRDAYAYFSMLALWPALSARWFSYDNDTNDGRPTMLFLKRTRDDAIPFSLALQFSIYISLGDAYDDLLYTRGILMRDSITGCVPEGPWRYVLARRISLISLQFYAILMLDYFRCKWAIDQSACANARAKDISHCSTTNRGLFNFQIIFFWRTGWAYWQTRMPFEEFLLHGVSRYCRLYLRHAEVW